MAACRGVLEKPIVDGEVKGSQIVYAAHDLTLHKTDWPLWCSDIPSAKASVPKGAPICGLYATGPSASAVRLLLDLRLKQLRSLIKTTDREAA
jgi:predicted ATP-grasp superfamily ATP-dependent carboligase